MGRLTVTPLTNTSSLACKGTVDNQPSDSTVYAEIKINAQVYKYQISGVPFSCLRNLPALVGHLEHHLKIQRPFKTRVRDDDYEVPRQLTLSAAGQPSQAQVITSSARALCDVLNGIAKNNKPADIQTLIINDKAQFFRYRRAHWFTWFTSGALELLPKAFANIKPIHFSALTILQLYLTDTSATVILGVADLLHRNCLPQLKTLDLQLSGWCRASRHRTGGWIYTNDFEKPAVDYLLHKGLIDASTPPLEHLHLPFWCARGTELGLTALRRFYPGLKTLAIDMIVPTAVPKEVRLNWSNSYTGSTTVPNGYGYTTSTYTINNAEYSTELRIPEPEEVADNPSLLTLLEEMQKVSQLECLEVYDWPVNENFVPEYATLTTAIANGWLPKLNTIALRFNIIAGHEYLLETTIDPKTATDVSSLLEAVIEARVPLKKLFLIMPEKQGYQNWLDEMSNGSFPELEQFHYRLPDRWLGEKDSAYHARVEKALDTLYRAVKKGQLPELKAFIVEGNHAIAMKLNIEAPPLPENIWVKIDQIEKAIQVQQTSENFINSLLVLEELGIETSSTLFHTSKSSQTSQT
jgi:hypothetical protein